MKKTFVSLIIVLLWAFPSFAIEKKSIDTYSKNIIAIDRKSLCILYEKNAFDSVPMASTTKIMTCIIALENSSMNDIISISKKASTINGSTLGLRENQKISMHDLLYGLMLRSGNDCAIAIAEYIAGSTENFAILMNQKAQDLKFLHTHFVTPHGLDDFNHYTSAYDLAILTDYTLNNEEFRKIVSTKQCTIYIDNVPRTIQNTNELLGNLDGVYGVKTGFTFNAGRCLVSACKRNTLDIIVVVLGADTKNIRTQDSKKIINFIFDNYEYVNINKTLENNFNKIINSCSNQLHISKSTDFPIMYLEPKENYEIPFIKNEPPDFHFKINLQNSFSPSTIPNSIVGSISVFNHNTLIFKTNILLKNVLRKNNWKYYFVKCLYSIF